jgi:polysaccharide export outer membrane protein
MYLRRVLENLRLPTVLLCAVSLFACADGRSGPELGSTSSPQLPRIYRLGIGDKIKLGVYGEQDLSGQFEVNALGAVPLPLIGEVPAKGLSIQEFRDTVHRRLAAGYVKAPKVNVEVVSYRPIYVHGEVKNGGEFPFKNGIRLRDAIAMAGGYTYRAQQGYLLITRDGEPSEMRVPMPSGTIVLPGDNIRIPERFF